MNHASVHDSSDDTSAVLSHFQRDAHRFIGVFLELHKSYARDMLKLSTVICYVVDLIATVEIGRDGWGRDAQCFFTIDLSCDHVVRVQQSLRKNKKTKVLKD